MTEVVIMAGGKGLRLHALTQRGPQVPKPMLRVGSKPLLETIIDGFAEYGLRRFHIATHYKAELIEGYFGDGSSRGLSIKYIREHEPLGTAGALRFMRKADGPFFVSNADILADINYADMLDKHNCEATMALALYQHQIPYGVVECDGNDRVNGIAEKPIKNYLVNAGVYILPPKAKDMIPAGPYDMPNLLNRLSVGAYAIEGHWYDVGQFADLAAAHINWSLKVA